MQPSECAQPNTLPRCLRLVDAVAIVVGSVIGSGVFLKAQTIARELPGTPGLPGFWPILSVWVGVGLVTLCGSLALAELAAMLPQAGGPYVYLRDAFGRLPAFLWGWTEFWIIRTGSLGALASATVISLNDLLELRGYSPLAHWTQAGLAISFVLGLAAVNAAGTRWGARVQNLTTAIKFSFLLAIILLPWMLRKADPQLLQTVGQAPPDYSFWRGYAAAIIAVMWAYDGWINIGPVAEEIHHPQRNVPVALLVGMAAIIFVYVGANVSYHLVQPIGTIAQSKATPAASLMQVLLGSTGGQIATIAVMCSTFGALNSNMLTGPRIYFSMARDGLLPRAFHAVHPRWQTPANAILLQSLWGVVVMLGAYAWTAGSSGKAANAAFDTLTNYAIFGGLLFYALAVAAVFVLRARRPDLPRPYRTWGYPFTPALYLVAFAGFLASILVAHFQESLAGSGVIAAGVVYYFVVTKLRKAK